MQNKFFEIIYLLPELRFGGVQIFALDMAYHQITEGFKVKIFSVGKSYDVLERYNIKKKSLLKDSIFLTNQLSILIYIIKAVIIRRPIKIHTQGFLLTCVGFFSIFKNVNIIHTIQNEPIYEAGKIRSTLHSFFFNILNVKTVANSEIIGDKFDQYYGYKVNDVILNGVDIDNLQPLDQTNYVNVNDKGINILTVGSLGHHKNQKLLIDAFIQLNYENSYLYIIGKNYDNYLSDDFINDVKKNRVYILGERKDSFSFMDSCDIFCMSSRNEGLPLVLMEAKMKGMIAVVTDAGGSREILDESDYLVTSHEIKDYKIALQKSILAVNNNDYERPSTKKTKFNIQRCHEDYLKISFR